MWMWLSTSFLVSKIWPHSGHMYWPALVSGLLLRLITWLIKSPQQVRKKEKGHKLMCAWYFVTHLLFVKKQRTVEWNVLPKVWLLGDFSCLVFSMSFIVVFHAKLSGEVHTRYEDDSQLCLYCQMVRRIQGRNKCPDHFYQFLFLSPLSKNHLSQSKILKKMQGDF